MTGCVREVDTVARFGGDEFVAVLAELDTDEDGQSESTLAYHCSASIGIAMFGNHATSQDDVLK